MTKRFTVVDTRSNQVKTFNSEATTVGELKQDLRNIGINPDGMAIQEGLTKTELGSDSSLLPSDVNYRGTVTNNLVFRLTQPNKKIKSGNTCMAEIYDGLKNLERAIGNMMSDVHKERPVCSSSNSVVDCLATLTSILRKKGLITASEANSVVEPLIGVKIFDEEEKVSSIDYELETIFGDYDDD